MRCSIRLLLGMLLSSGAVSVQAQLVASPWELDFDVEAIQTTSAPKATTLRNTGNASVTVVAMATFLPPTGVFARAGGTCGEVPFTLAPQATCTIQHTFTPRSIYTYFETIRMTLAQGAPVDFGLRGEGDVGRLVITPMTLHFFPTPVGSVGQELTADLHNDRQAPFQILEFRSTSVPATSAFVRTGGTCPTPPFQFYAYSSCTLTYTFFPAQEGQSTMNMDIRTSGTSGNFPLWLSGDGLPEISLFGDGFEEPAPAPIQ
jgi:hypothetical protein